MSYQTPWSAQVEAGTYRVTMDSMVTVAGNLYQFSQWEDGDHSNPRDIVVGTVDVSHTATYIQQQGTTTPWSSKLDPKSYTITVPLQVIQAGSTYNFVHWEDGSTNNAHVINLTSDKTVTATYQLAPPVQVTVNVVAGSNGSVSPSGSQLLTVGQSYSFSATPYSGYSLDHWDLGGTNKGSSNPLVITATSDINGKTLTALFTANPPAQVTVTIAVLGSGTTDLTGQHTFNVGDTVTITAIPSTGQAFINWTMGSVTLPNPTQNPLHLTVTSAMNGQTLTATFATPITSSIPLVAAVAGLGLLVVGVYLASRKKR